jgi:ribonuclease BN (tRNA processing enzyme)
MIEVVILGSGSALPQIGRANACYFVQTDLPLLLDFGPGALMNMLHAGIDRSQIGHLLWTHLHADHISEFVPFFFHETCYSKINHRRDLTLYGPAGTRKVAKSILRTFPGFDKADFKFQIKEIGSGRVKLGQTVVKAYPVKHSPSLQCLGYRIEYGQRTVVYSGDVSFGPELIELCKGADLAIIEATSPAEHPVEGHLTAPQACQAAKTAGVKKLVLTHFDPIWEGYNLEAQCEGLFDGEMIAANDLLRITV